MSSINLVTFDALAPTTTQGDTIYRNGTTNTRLAKGTLYQRYRMNAAANAPEWADREERLIPYYASVATWTNMPAAKTEFLGVALHSKVDLTEFLQVCLHGQILVVGAAAAVLFAEYSTDESTWNTLTSNQMSIASTGAKLTAWENMPAGAKGLVYLRVVGQSGDGALDPSLGPISIGFR